VLTALNSAQSQLLQQLRDIHPPEAVNWWPLATGWWIIIGLIALIALLLLIRFLLKRHHYRFVRFASAELHQLRKSDDPRWLAKSHNVMRRLGLCYVDEELAGSMNQQQWMQFLQDTQGQQLSNETIAVFVDLPYKPATASDDVDKDSVMRDIINWAEQLPEQVKEYTQRRQEEHHHV